MSVACKGRVRSYVRDVYCRKMHSVAFVLFLLFFFFFFFFVRTFVGLSSPLTNLTQDEEEVEGRKGECSQRQSLKS
jgi:membrane protein implicated in regulation of membrane protease activity